MKTGWINTHRGSRVGRIISMIAAVALLMLGMSEGSFAEPPASAPPTAPQAVPGGRAATNVAVITIRGQIDEWTLHSVKRRIEVARDSGADAIVFEVDSPGGEIISCVLISTAIKNSPIANTVAWVNPMAYSGGTIVSFACREIVIADGAVMGDALPIRVGPLGMLEGMGRDEREKFAGPVIADLIDSARRNRQDEMLVQGFVRRGVELWLAENSDTGQRLFVTPEQFKIAVGRAATDEDRLSPTVRSGFGPMDPRGRASGGPASAPSLSPPKRESRREDAPGAAGASAGGGGEKDFTPAGEVSPRIAAEINQDLDLKSVKSERPNLAAPEHKGKYTVVEYVCDGSGVITLRESELLRYRIAVRTVRTDDELKAFFGAKNLVRLDENWADHAARFLSNFIVRAILMVVFLVALFVEMSHPGLSLPGAIAAVCLLGIVLPPILAGIAGWWALLAIMAGIGLICVEVFITPGVAIFGVVGVLLLFSGLVGTFLIGPAAGSMFPGVGRSGGEIGWAVASVFITLTIAGVAIGVLLRYLPGLPMFNRLVLTSTPDDSGEAAPGPYAQPFSQDMPIKPGATGTAITPLRPAGRVQIGDRIVDAVADGAFVEAGGSVRVLTASPFRVTVEAIKA